MSMYSMYVCVCVCVCESVGELHGEKGGSAHLPGVKAKTLQGSAAGREDTKEKFFSTLSRLELNLLHLSNTGSDTIRR